MDRRATCGTWPQQVGTVQRAVQSRKQQEHGEETQLVVEASMVEPAPAAAAVLQRKDKRQENSPGCPVCWDRRT